MYVAHLLAQFVLEYVDVPFLSLFYYFFLYVQLENYLKFGKAEFICNKIYRHTLYYKLIFMFKDLKSLICFGLK